ncbi:MAG: HAD family phosphatase [Ginsengibacter sp.]
METIENIIFDFGGVFLDIDYSRTRAAFESLGVARFEEMYSQADADMLFQKLEKGDISVEQFYIDLKKTTGLDLSTEDIDHAWNAMLLQYRESSIQYLEKLSQRYELYLFSNTNFIHMRAFRKLFQEQHNGASFDDYFTKTFYSCEMGSRKPDHESFQSIINELGIDPQKTLFIDDSIQNINAAKEVGLQVIHLTSGINIEDLGLLK